MFKKLFGKIETGKVHEDDTIYIDPVCIDYWWGVHGISELEHDEEIGLYQKHGKKYKKVDMIFIYAKPYLKNHRSEFDDAIYEELDRDEVNAFLEQEEEMYRFAYDDSEGPCRDIWHKAYGIDKAVIDECVIAYCKEYLSLDIKNVLYKKEVSHQEAKKSYKAHRNL